MIDLTELQQEVHTLAREKGFYDDRDLSDPDVRAAMLALIHSEVSEALECVRRGEMALAYDYAFKRRSGKQVQYTLGGRKYVGKPVGFPSELADVVIRCLDFRAAFPETAALQEPCYPWLYKVGTPIAIASEMYELHDSLVNSSMSWVIAECFGIAQALGFDLLEVIRIKHEYNKTRPRRHGGKAL